MTGPRPRIESEGDPAPPLRVPEPLPVVAPPPPVRPAPRVEAESLPAARLLPAELPDVPVAPVAGRAGMGTASLALAGVTVLVVGLAALETGDFVADQFRRGPVLGWVTLAVAVSGFGLVLAAVGRELRGLLALRAVDRLRRDLAGADAVRRHRAARRWVRALPEAEALLPALDAVNDPDAILSLLRAGPERTLRARADALGRGAALQVVAGMAAAPAPALVVLLVSWRGLRLIRQVAAAYGLRPGLLGTLALLRRTVLAAGAVAATEVAVNAAAHGLLSTPLLQHLAGEMAGGAVAARRMVVLARAAATACSPVPRE